MNARRRQDAIADVYAEITIYGPLLRGRGQVRELAMALIDAFVRGYRSAQKQSP